MKIVVVDELLSHDAVFEQTAEATGFLIGGAGFVEAQLPFVTLTLSGWREAKLLSQSRTTASAALRNLGLDVAGVGAGGLGGAKVGAVLGGVVGGPPGAAAGAVVGAIAGALTGKRLSNHLKHGPLREATSALEASQEAFGDEVRCQTQGMMESYERDREEAEHRLSVAATEQHEQLSSSVAGIREWGQRTATLSPEEVSELIEAAHEELTCLRQDIAAQLKRRGVLPLLWPRSSDFSMLTALHRLRSLRKQVSRLSTPSSQSRLQLYNALGKAGLLEAQVVEALNSNERERTERESYLRGEIGVAQGRMADERQAAVQWLVDRLRELQREKQQALELPAEELRSRYDRVRKEADRLGKK